MNEVFQYVESNLGKNLKYSEKLDFFVTLPNNSSIHVKQLYYDKYQSSNVINDTNFDEIRSILPSKLKIKEYLHKFTSIYGFFPILNIQKFDLVIKNVLNKDVLDNNEFISLGNLLVMLKVIDYLSDEILDSKFIPIAEHILKKFGGENLNSLILINLLKFFYQVSPDDFSKNNLRKFQKYEIESLRLAYCLGIEFSENNDDKKLWYLINQPNLNNVILNGFPLDLAKNHKLKIPNVEMSFLNNDNDQCPESKSVNQTSLEKLLVDKISFYPNFQINYNKLVQRILISKDHINLNEVLNILHQLKFKLPYDKKYPKNIYKLFKIENFFHVTYIKIILLYHYFKYYQKEKSHKSNSVLDCMLKLIYKSLLPIIVKIYSFENELSKLIDLIFSPIVNNLIELVWMINISLIIQVKSQIENILPLEKILSNDYYNNLVVFQKKLINSNNLLLIILKSNKRNFQNFKLSIILPILQDNVLNAKQIVNLKTPVEGIGEDFIVDFKNLINDNLHDYLALVNSKLFTDSTDSDDLE
ncbi:hypothetical protein CLIB1444_01S13542 [[Candida] jaroonii]|uniref:Uncharacterized protein n=1 Tax=[Candida] jaroonii TaxID=467808 RepID=A0ACA9Y1C1_9ASCO|nr:hypothetical protein CLIB1444_01S13542 [[Candida] jaroonii]